MEVFSNTGCIKYGKYKKGVDKSESIQKISNKYNIPVLPHNQIESSKLFGVVTII